MTRWIKESEKRLPVTVEHDVLVVGGGIAGAVDVTKQVLDTHVLLRRKLTTLKRGATPGSVYPVSLPTIPSFRMTRRLEQFKFVCSVWPGCGCG